MTLLLYLFLTTTPAHHQQCGNIYVCDPETGICKFIYVPCQG